MLPRLLAALAAFGTAPTPAPTPELEFADDLSAPIVASVYSLPPSMVEPVEAERFLAAVHSLAPARDLVVFTGEPLSGRLSGHQGLGAAEGQLHLLTTDGSFSLWPRDPFLLARRRDGGVVVVARPNVQPGREADGDMAAALVRGLPAALARSWGGVSPAVAPLPFHGGNLLQTAETAWTTLHGLERSILERLHLDAVPVESFATAAGRDRYLAAASAAATDLGRWLGREVRLVHPNGTTLDLMRRIGGGAGFDLDSIVTFLPAPEGRTAVLVADVAAGARLVATATDGDLEGLRSAYELGPAPGDLRRDLSAYAGAERAADLARFLELCAAHLAALGHRVERLPILVMPTAALADRRGVEHTDFLVTWNNVVLEPGRAEGFASGLPSGDARAKASFAALGVRLDLVPTLRRSVVLSGGYRCASNHLRDRGSGGPGSLP